MLGVSTFGPPASGLCYLSHRTRKSCPRGQWYVPIRWPLTSLVFPVKLALMSSIGHCTPGGHMAKHVSARTKTSVMIRSKFQPRAIISPLVKPKIGRFSHYQPRNRRPMTKLAFGRAKVEEPRLFTCDLLGNVVFQFWTKPDVRPACSQSQSWKGTPKRAKSRNVS